MKQEIQEW